MSRTLLWVAVGLAVLAGAAWLLVSAGVVASPFADERRTDVDEKPPGALEGAAENAPSATLRPDGTATSKPLLAAAGRHPERAGFGSATARVVRSSDNKAVAGARLALVGTSHAGEAVEARGTTDDAGAVKLDKVPAGLGYVVRVEVAGEPSVELPDVEVKAGRAKDLGTILVGARVDVTGRVVDEKGEGIAGADVRGYTTFANLAELMSNFADLFTSLGHEPTPLARTTSASDGRFRLEGLAPGAVALRATSPGRRQGVAMVRLAAGGPETPPTVLTLPPGAAVSGVVVDAAGPAIPGATVAIFVEGGADPLQFTAGRVFAKTDDQGRFAAFVDPAAKRLRAIVEADGYPTAFGPSFDAGATNVRVVVQRGADLEATMLYEGTEQPVVGVTVGIAIGETDDMDGPDAAGSMVSGVTDAQGVARMPARPGHLQMLMFSGPGGVAGMLSPKMDLGARSGAATGKLPTVIAAGAPTRFTLHVKRALSVAGVVRSAAGKPIAGAEVSSAAFFGGGGGAPVRTDAQGAYQISMSGGGMFGMGSAMLSVKAAGFVTETVTVTLDNATREKGEATADVVMKPGATVRGKVVGPDGKPVVGAKVSYASGEFNYASMLEAMSGGGITTDADGTYVLRDVASADGTTAAEAAIPGSEPTRLPAGKPAATKARVKATADGYVAKSTEPFVVPEGAQVEAPTIRLSRGATIVGVVLDPGGRPAAGAAIEFHVARDDADGMPDVSVMMGANPPKSTTDAEGRFELPAIAKGTATVTASRSGAAPTRRTLKIGSEDEKQAIEIALRPASDLRGVVLDRDGRPVARASVSVSGSLVGRDGDDAFVEPVRTKTDAEGRFTLAGLPPGTVEVSVTADAFKGAKQSSPTGGSLEVRLEARPTADAKRLGEIETEINETTMKLLNAKDDGERATLRSRLAELQMEKKALSGEKSDDGKDGGGD